MDRFKWSILALAQSPETQIALFPQFVPAGEELALNFEQALEAFDLDQLSVAQKAALQSLDQLICALSGQRNETFWLDNDALSQDERWGAIRARARTVAQAFGWQHDTPPYSLDNYIQPKAV